jgi:cobyrinic acid a,c-diamide synthase
VTARIVVAGTHSGAGKTTVATGLIAALVARGLKVAPFKVGPDFIDPSYHRLAAGRPGRNLDAYLCGPDLIEPLFVHGARGADVAVIEGVMGLFDGAAGGELASTAHAAKLLRAPLLLVVDARSMSRSVAALVCGFRDFDPGVQLAGVLLNRVGSESHEQVLRAALAPCGVPVVGVLRRDPSIETPSRHLGLVPAPSRADEAERAIVGLAGVIERYCDISAIVRIARRAPASRARAWHPQPREAPARTVRVAVAGGSAFTFVYEENLELLKARGADVLCFDPTVDEDLPAGVDAVYLGGGFPETYGDELSANAPMRARIHEFASSGRPVVAECGGLLYLCKTLEGKQMCGVVDADAHMTERLTLGYRMARAATDSVLARRDQPVSAHEFHYSVVEPRVGARPVWDVDGRLQGFASSGVHASYLHVHWAPFPEIADNLVASAERTEVLAT